MNVIQNKRNYFSIYYVYLQQKSLKHWDLSRQRQVCLTEQIISHNSNSNYFLRFNLWLIFGKKVQIEDSRPMISKLHANSCHASSQNSIEKCALQESNQKYLIYLLALNFQELIQERHAKMFKVLIFEAHLFEMFFASVTSISFMTWLDLSIFSCQWTMMIGPSVVWEINYEHSLDWAKI